MSLAVGPNPSSGVVRVALTGAEASPAGTVDVSVYDALGRRVAVLHDGALGAAGALAFDGSAWPAGLYVVRAVVRVSDGSAAGVSVLTRAVTVAR